MKNKKILIIFAIIICIMLIIIAISLNNTNNEKTNTDVEEYVKEHYLNPELLNYMTGDVTIENKMAYTIDVLNEKSGEKVKEISKDQVIEEYKRIFSEDLEINEAAFMLVNNYEFEQSRGTFLQKNESSLGEKQEKENGNKNENKLVITNVEYDNSKDKYIVTIEEKTNSEKAQTIKKTKLELEKQNEDYIITDYYKV